MSRIPDLISQLGKRSPEQRLEAIRMMGRLYGTRYPGRLDGWSGHILAQQLFNRINPLDHDCLENAMYSRMGIPNCRICGTVLEDDLPLIPSEEETLALPGGAPDVKGMNNARNRLLAS